MLNICVLGFLPLFDNLRSRFTFEQGTQSQKLYYYSVGIVPCIGLNFVQMSFGIQ